MKRRGGKTREEFYFTVQNVFPPSDKLGLDILRLMAAYNDIGRIIDWLKSEPHNQANAQAKRISSARKSMQMRLLASFLHEASEVIKGMHNLEDFQRLHGQMSPRGQEAFESLRNYRAHFKNSILSVIDRVRNKATFHYLRPYFADAIKEFKAKRGEAIRSSFIFEKHSSSKVRAYYLLADHLRDVVAFGIVTPQEANVIINQLAELQKNLIIFLDSAMEAYGKDRGLRDQFSLNPEAPS